MPWHACSTAVSVYSCCEVKCDSLTALRGVLTNTRILWAFNITPPVDSQGNKMLPSADSFTSGLITRPTPFKCCFEPRSQNAREVIIQEAERAELEASAWKS